MLGPVLRSSNDALQELCTSFFMWPACRDSLYCCRQEVEADLQFAANAAAFFSKARNEGKAEVVYAFVKDLNKPKGARPGQVMFTSFGCSSASCLSSVLHGWES